MNEEWNQNMGDVMVRLLTTADLLAEEITNAPDTATVTKAAKTIGDIDSVLQLIGLRG